jgi:2,3-bisphosphoglycerate-independent phosphoglycerate mutase
MVGVGVEVDPRHVARRARLMTLEEEVPAVVVVRVGTPEAALEHEIRVLVRLRLLGSTSPAPG